MVKVSKPAFPFHTRVLQHVSWVEPGQKIHKGEDIFLINWILEPTWSPREGRYKQEQGS